MPADKNRWSVHAMEKVPKIVFYVSLGVHGKDPISMPETDSSHTPDSQGKLTPSKERKNWGINKTDSFFFFFFEKRNKYGETENKMTHFAQQFNIFYGCNSVTI